MDVLVSCLYTIWDLPHRRFCFRSPWIPVMLVQQNWPHMVLDRTWWLCRPLNIKKTVRLIILILILDRRRVLTVVSLPNTRGGGWGWGVGGVRVGWGVGGRQISLSLLLMIWIRSRSPDASFIWCEECVDTSHYNDVIMGAIASHTTCVSIVCSTVGSGVDQRKHQSSTSLAFVRGINRWPVNSPYKGPVTRKMFLFHKITRLIMLPASLQLRHIERDGVKNHQPHDC